MGFPGGSDGKESAHNEGDLGSIPGLERSPGRGVGNPPLYSAWRTPMDRGAWQAIVHGVTESQTQLMGNSLLFLGYLMLGKDTDKGEASGKPL